MTKYSLAVTSLALAIAFASAGAAAQNLNPVPDYYQDPGISPNRNYINESSGEHIDPYTGKLQFHTIDMFLPGNGGMDIKVQRSYSSIDGFVRDPSPYGIGWTIGFGRIVASGAGAVCVVPGGTLSASFELPDGSRQQLYAGDTQFFTASDLSSKTGMFITKNLYKTYCAPGGVGLTVLSPDGTQYNMTVQGPTVIVGTGSAQQSQTSFYPASIVDRNGNTLNFTYVTFGQYLATNTVSAADGRIVTFSYDANGLLTGVTDGTRTVGYHSHAAANLSGYVYLDTVTRQDGTTWLFTYNENFTTPTTPGQGSVASITYPTGGQYDYTYEIITFYPTQAVPSNVIATKTIPGGTGVGSDLIGTTTWTFTYAPSTTQWPSGSTASCGATTPNYIDLTTVAGPDGTKYYCHWGYMTSYANALAPAGQGWQIGTSLARIAGPDIEYDANQALLITAAQALVYPSGLFYEYTYASIVSNRSLNRDGQNFSSAYSNFDVYGNPGLVSESGHEVTLAQAVAAGSGGTIAPLTTSRNTTYTYYTDPVKWILHPKATEAPVVDGVALGTIQRTFDSNANVLTENHFGVTTAWTYFPTGDVATKIDALGNETLYSSYKCGIPQQEQYPIQAPPETVTSYETVGRVVDNFGNVTSQTDGAGATTTYAYDGLNRLTKIQHPLGYPVVITWAANSRTLIRSIYFQETTDYDPFGRKSFEQAEDTASGNGVFTNYTYDALGRLVFQTDPSSTTGTQFDYDLVGRKIKTWFACPVYGQTASCLASTSATYQTVSNLITDELGNLTQYLYQGYGDPSRMDLLAVMPADGSANTGIVRNGLGQLASVTQGNSNLSFTRNYTYNTSFFLTGVDDPETGQTTYGRDAVGNMISRQVGTSGTTNFVYDGMNRLTNTNYPAGTPSVARSYYLDNKIQLIDNGIAQRSFVYDQNKNLTSETLAIPAASQTFTTGYSYNTLDALSTMTYGSGEVVSFNPDHLNRPTSALPFIDSGVSYFPNGMIQQFGAANGIYTSFTQNARLWPATMQVAGGSNSVLNSQYTYDNAGNLTGIGDSIDSTQNRTISYDVLQRVSNVTGPWGAMQISYDGIGNIGEQTTTQQIVGLGTLTYLRNYQYDTNNRLTGMAYTLVGNTPMQSFTYSYDTYGNVSNNGASAFSYNDAANMTCANCGTAAEVDYQYDGQGLRISATPFGGTPTYFVYSSSGSLLWEFTPGVALKEYVYLGGKQVAVRRVDESTGGTPIASVNLVVSGSVSASSAAVGTPVTYSVTVTNSGTQAASSVAVVNVIPPQLSFISGSTGCANISGTVTCAIGALAASGQTTVQIQAMAATAGSSFDVASVTSSLPNSSGVGGSVFLPVSVH